MFGICDVVLDGVGVKLVGVKNVGENGVGIGAGVGVKKVGVNDVGIGAGVDMKCVGVNCVDVNGFGVKNVGENFVGVNGVVWASATAGSPSIRAKIPTIQALHRLTLRRFMAGILRTGSRPFGPQPNAPLHLNIPKY